VFVGVLVGVGVAVAGFWHLPLPETPLKGTQTNPTQQLCPDELIKHSAFSVLQNFCSSNTPPSARTVINVINRENPIRNEIITFFIIMILKIK
jgi:hypothetical protein